MIIFDGTTYDFDSTGRIVNHYPEFEPIHNFIRKWRQGDVNFTFHTSGSTGIPKSIDVHRSQIESSVHGTGSYLNLDKNDRALIALNPGYIASIMMAARAIVIDMDLIIEKPTSNPTNIINAHQISLASFVPYQIYTLMELNRLRSLEKIDQILIGGAPLNQNAVSELSQLSSKVYLTYGMTETVSHIALMPLQNQQSEGCFELLDGISVGLNHDQTLWIDGPITNHQRIQTNDIAELIDDKHFKWLGRADNIINSGGVKIYPESLEKLISSLTGVPNDHFFVHGIDDVKLGKRLILIVEHQHLSRDILKEISTPISDRFGKYHVPKEVITNVEFIRTSNDKLNRKQTAGQLF